MALIKCPVCGKMFSEHAECCPECGFKVEPHQEIINKGTTYKKAEPIESPVHKHRIWYYILGIVGVLAIGIGSYVFCCGEGGLLNNTIVGDTIEISTTPTNMKIYKGADNLYNCFIVVSKRNMSLKVYESLNNDTALLALFPVCLGTNRGPKQQEGDKKTPETTMEKPFFITQIQNSSSWRHDFEDGRGPVASYGDWFARLATGFNGIGIYGSYYFESDVPGRKSTGSVVLKPNDFAHLKEHYLFEGMKVVVKKENQGLLPFEITAYKK